jgi:hypothetical protein
MSENEFVVKDRRRFTEQGEIREQEEADQKTGAPEASGPSPQDEAPNRTEQVCAGPPPLPEVNFSTFIISLGTSALMNLGELPDPSSNQTCRNLPLAKQTIDILAMLQTKTQKNLDREEENLLNNLLYELRIKYVGAVNKT